MSFASPSNSRCSRAAISTGCTSPLNARAKTPLTAPSTFFSNRSRMPMSLLPQATLDASRRLHRGADHVVFVTQMVLSRITIAAADNGWRASLSRLDHAASAVQARVAERQTRWLQVPVSARTWGFKSPLAHQYEPRPDLGLYGIRGRLKGPIVAPLWHRLSSEALAWHGLNSTSAPSAA